MPNIIYYKSKIVVLMIIYYQLNWCRNVYFDKYYPLQDKHHCQWGQCHLHLYELRKVPHLSVSLPKPRFNNDETREYIIFIATIDLSNAFRLKRRTLLRYSLNCQFPLNSLNSEDLPPNRGWVLKNKNCFELTHDSLSFKTYRFQKNSIFSTTSRSV